MRSIRALAWVLAPALACMGCATRLPATARTVPTTARTVPSTAQTLPPTAPSVDLQARFVRCETEGMTREVEIEREELSKHKLNLFLGYTGERGEGGGQTVGFDYLYRINHHWGVGAFVDLAAGGIRARVIGAGLDFHPIEPIFLFVGPGIEWVDGESQGLLRVGGGYEFEVGEKVILGPAVYIDFLEDGEFAWVVGFILGYEL